MSEPMPPASDPKKAHDLTEHHLHPDAGAEAEPSPLTIAGSRKQLVADTEHHAEPQDAAVDGTSGNSEIVLPSHSGATVGYESVDAPAPAVNRHTTDFEAHKPRVHHSDTVAPENAVRIAPASPRRAHAVVGSYEILGELGRGGMGVVYKARHQRLHRLVALKMILAGGRARAIDLERFQSEAEAVAQVHHRNIVQIYEIGEHEGLPFIALEFVEGGSMDGRTESRAQDPRAAAELVRQMAEAINVAHRNGIIHRDLKPANVMLAGADDTPLDQCVPKITDFGLARRFEGDSGQTREGSILGTPSYMSPEQAQGKQRDLGPPTDIYALGAILYDLLTGEPPFQGPTVLDTLRLVVETEPRPPIALQPTLPLDLQVICMKCLEKDPAHRYTSAGALAEDLRRFLEGEPILARPAPIWERTWKWCRRRPSLSALIGVSVASVLAFGIGLFLYAQTQGRLRREADVERAEKEQERQRAEDNFQKAELARVAEKSERQRAEDNFQKAVKERAEKEQERQRAEDNFKKAETARVAEERERQRAEVNFKQAETARAAEKTERQRAEENFKKAEQSRLAAEKAQQAEKIQRQQAQDNFQKAEKARLAEEIERQRAEDNFQKAEKARAAEARERQRAQNNFTEARDAVRQLTDIGQRRLAHEPHMELVRRDILETALRFHRRFLEINGDTPALRYQAGLAQLRVGEIEDSFGRLDAAEKAYRTAADQFTALITEAPGQRDYRDGLATARGNLALLYQAANHADADTVMDDAIRLREELVRDHKNDRDLRHALAYVRINRGIVRHARQEVAPAEEDYNRALDLLTALAAEFPLDTDSKPRKGAPQGDELTRVTIQQELGRTQLSLGALWTGRQSPRAEAAYALAAQILESLSERYPDLPHLRQELANTYLNRGTLRRLSGRGDDANADYQLASNILTRLAGQFRSVPDYRLLLVDTYISHGKLLRDAKLPAEAEKLWRLSLPLLKELADEFPAQRVYRQKLGRIHNELGIVLGMQNKINEAEQAFRDGLAVLEPLAKKKLDDAPVWRDLGNCSANLASLLGGTGKQDAAEELVRRTLETQQNRVKVKTADRQGHEDVAESWNMLAELLAGRKKNAESADALEQAAAAWARTAALAKGDKAISVDQRRAAEEKGRRQAVKSLQLAIERGLKDVVAVKEKPEFAELRDDPAFKELKERP